MELFTRQGSLIEQHNIVSADLIKGTGVYRFINTCGRCGGSGVLTCYIRVNGGVCFQCNGAAKWPDTDKCYTQIKLDKLNATAEKKRLNKEAKANAKADKRDREVVQPFLKANEELFLNVERVQAARHNDFIGNMMRTIRNSNSISERQIEVLDGHVAKFDTEQENMKPVPEGKIEVQGQVLSTKVERIPFGYNQVTTTYKMLIQCQGYKLWGSIPKKIVDTVEDDLDELKGKQVKFTANVTPKGNGFGFYKRPSKASIL